MCGVEVLQCRLDGCFRRRWCEWASYARTLRLRGAQAAAIRRKFPGSVSRISAIARKTTRREAYVPNIVYSLSLLCETRFASVRHHMVDIAQPVEHLIVVQKVARSSRVIHPINPGFARGFVFLPALFPRGDSVHQVLGAFAIVALANRVIGVIYRNVCPVVVCIGAWIIVPACVRTLYAVACEAGQMSAGSGGAPPCPAACACSDIRNSAYRLWTGRDVPRLPCGVCRGIRKPALPPPERQEGLPSSA